MRVERIDVAIHLESFWRRELVIGITADTAQARLVPEPGSKPFTFEMPERFQLGPITARLSSIRLERSRLRYEDEANGFTLALDGLAATGRPQGGGLELTARVDTVNFRVGGVTEKLERLAIEGRIDATRVLVRRLEAGGDDRTLKVAGAIESPWTQPVLAAEATVRLGLGPITRNLGSAVPVEGTAAIDLTLGGPLASPVVSGRLHLERLDVADVNARDLSASFTYDTQALTLADLARPVARWHPDGLADRARAHPARCARPIPSGRRGRRRRGPPARRHARRAGPAHPRRRGPWRSFPPAIVAGSGPGGRLGRCAARERWRGLGIGRVKAVARTNAGEVVSDVDASWPSANLTARVRLDPDRRLRLQARGRADLSALPEWAGRAVDVQLSGDGTWPLVAGTAVVDLTRRRSATRCGPDRRSSHSCQGSDPELDGQPPVTTGLPPLGRRRRSADRHRAVDRSARGRAAHRPRGRCPRAGLGTLELGRERRRADRGRPGRTWRSTRCESRSGSRGHRPARSSRPVRARRARRSRRASRPSAWP